MQITLGQQYNVGEKPTVILYTLFTLIAMQGHEKNIKNKPETMYSSTKAIHTKPLHGI